MSVKKPGNEVNNKKLKYNKDDVEDAEFNDIDET